MPATKRLAAPSDQVDGVVGGIAAEGYTVPVPHVYYRAGRDPSASCQIRSTSPPGPSFRDRVGPLMTSIDLPATDPDAKPTCGIPAATLRRERSPDQGEAREAQWNEDREAQWNFEKFLPPPTAPCTDSARGPGPTRR